LIPDEGEGTCLGYDVLTESFKIKANIGYMPKKFGLYDDLTVVENLFFVARIYGLSNPKSVVNETIESMELDFFNNRLAGALSGGWKQRLALAACLMHKPKLLLLDEPTAGVDPKARRDFWDKIHELSAEGITILVSTHYMDEAERCHEMAYLYYGDLLVRGSTESITQDSKLFSHLGLNVDLNTIKRLKNIEGLIVAPFGNKLHVCSYDENLLKNAIRVEKKTQWEEVSPTLEDVFIALMSKKQERV
jgi:ABC-2 type transport system ATP-binding protein